MDNVGDLIKKYRKRQNKSQLEISLSVGWENPSTLSRIEKGEVKPIRETLLKIGSALKLPKEDINILLKIYGYLDFEPEITDEYKKYLIDILKDDWDKLNYPMILIQDIPTEVVLWNKATQYFFIGKGKFVEIFVNVMKNKTHIELLFEKKYGLRNNIQNWDVFSRICVENMYAWNKLNGYDTEFEASLDKWMKIPAFKKIWEECDKSKAQKYVNFNIPVTYKHPKIGILNFTITTFTLFEDHRFYVQQFIPNTVADSEKLNKFMNT